MRRISVCLLLTVLGFACRSDEAVLRLDDAAVRAQVDSAVAAYLGAGAQHDAEKLVAFYLDSPEFQVIANGESMDYPTWSAIQRTSRSAVREVRGGYTDLRTTSLGPSAALVSGRRDQTTIDSSGQAVRRRGAASWVWVKREGHWRVIHINTHYTEEPGR